MYVFNVEAVTVTEQKVSLHGVWDLGGSKRFQVVHLPVSFFVNDHVLQALNQIHSDAPGTKRSAQLESVETLPLWG